MLSRSLTSTQPLSRCPRTCLRQPFLALRLDKLLLLLHRLCFLGLPTLVLTPQRTTKHNNSTLPQFHRECRRASAAQNPSRPWQGAAQAVKALPSARSLLRQAGLEQGCYRRLAPPPAGRPPCPQTAYMLLTKPTGTEPHPPARGNPACHGAAPPSNSLPLRLPARKLTVIQTLLPKPAQLPR